MRERVKPSVDSTEEGRRELARKRVASDATAARARYELCGIYEGAARRLGLDRRTAKARAPAHEGGVGVGRAGSRGELDVRQPAHELVEHDAELEAGEVRAQAEVVADAERDVRGRAAGHAETAPGRGEGPGGG